MLIDITSVVAKRGDWESLDQKASWEIGMPICCLGQSLLAEAVHNFLHFGPLSFDKILKWTASVLFCSIIISKFKFCIKNAKEGVEEIANQLRAPSVLPEDPG